ncbi:MAG: hypothetical protein HFJ52_06020 [Clostridia bacterium]|nr:hypothetical protein [Clostridia bacterium]
MPGRQIPITIVLEPSSITLPLETEIFLLTLLSIKVPQTKVKGVYKVTFFPLTFTT